MQTKRQIRDLIASAGVVPKRTFGQHFLVDLNLLRLLVEAADIGAAEPAGAAGAGAAGSLLQPATASRAPRAMRDRYFG